FRTQGRVHRLAFRALLACLLTGTGKEHARGRLLHLETISLQQLYGLFFIELGSRPVHLAGCTAKPTGTWATQHARQFSRHQPGTAAKTVANLETRNVSVQSAGTRLGAANEPVWSAQRRRRFTRRDASRWSRRWWRCRCGWRRRTRSWLHSRSGSRSSSSG